MQKGFKLFFSDLYWRIFPVKILRYHVYRIEKFVQEMASQYDVSGKSLIDIGAQDGVYKKYFRHLRYVTQDIQQNKSGTVDIIGDINEGIAEISDESFDYILCTQVLEHIREPHKVFREFCRILKPGGKIFLTTHLCFEEHMIPHDYFRFTRYGLRYLGEGHGFTVERIAPHGGIFQVLALIIDTIPVKLFFKRGILYYIYGVIFTVPILALNSLCAILDIFDRDPIMTLNYECIYRKN